MFCGNCGTKNDAGTAFCENCGARLEAEAQAAPVNQQPPVYQQAPVYQQPAPPAPKKSKLPVVIGAIIVAIAIAVGCYFLLGNDGGKIDEDEINDSAENAALAFVTGLTEDDVDLALKAVYPEMEGIKSEIIDQCNTLRRDMEENNIDCSNQRVINEENDDEEIDLAEEYLEESYHTYATIDELSMVTVRVDRTSGNEKDTKDIKVYVAKIDGNWYVIRTN